jgi:putative ABC transport system ATP-binding protein
VDVLVRTIRLRKSYGQPGNEVHALDGIDLTIHGGEFVAVMGPSGSGKSTFFNMVGALDAPSDGRIFIEGVDLAQLSADELAFLRCRKIGYIFQQYNLIPYLTALENVTTPMTFAGVPAEESRTRGMEILERVGLADRWFHRPVEMSGGQQQRVAIARAIANRPRILLCDEPTANLDFDTGRSIIDILTRLNAESGVSIICATHDHRMLDRCHRIIWIRDGRVERVAGRDEVTIRFGSMEGERTS